MAVSALQSLGDLCKRLRHLQGGDGYLGGGDALDAEGAVGDAPLLDHAAEGVVGDEAAVRRCESVVGEGASEVAVVEPGLDASAVVGDAGGEGDGIFHQIEGDRAAEMAGNGEVGGGGGCHGGGCLSPGRQLYFAFEESKRHLSVRLCACGERR